MSDVKKTNEEITQAVTGGFQKIEDGVVGGYKKIEDGVVGGYKKIESTVVGAYKHVEDAFVGRFLTREGETVEEAKARLAQEQAAAEPAGRAAEQEAKAGTGEQADKP